VTQLLGFDLRPRMAVILESGSLSVNAHVKKFHRVQREHGEDIAATFTVDSDTSRVILLSISSLGLFFDENERIVRVWAR
jgi:hypothetical protein